MNELIRITTNAQGVSDVSARELHAFLVSRQQFADWIKARIKQYGFIEGQDYVIVAEDHESSDEVNFHKPMKVSRRGPSALDYALSLDMAKELSMVERNEQGKQARRYFINSEKALRQIMAVGPAQLQQQEQRLALLEQQLRKMIEAQQQAARSLLELPRSTDPLPVETTRMKIQRIVNSYCRSKGVGQQEVWRRVYDRLYYLYRVSIRSYKRSERESWLDVAERNDHLEKIYAIVSAELVFLDD